MNDKQLHVDWNIFKITKMKVNRIKKTLNKIYLLEPLPSKNIFFLLQYCVYPRLVNNKFCFQMYLIFQIKRDCTIHVKIFVRVMPFSGVLNKRQSKWIFCTKAIHAKAGHKTQII